MRRFYGEIGYAESVETVPGVYDDVITERNYYGDVIRNSRRQDVGQNVNPEMTAGSSISIVADQYVFDNFNTMRYIKWMGVRWLIDEFDVNHPRLILRLGGRYNGPTPTTPDPA
jgi:hypothetical protein